MEIIMQTIFLALKKIQISTFFYCDPFRLVNISYNEKKIQFIPMPGFEPGSVG